MKSPLIEGREEFAVVAAAINNNNTEQTKDSDRQRGDNRTKPTDRPTD